MFDEKFERRIVDVSAQAKYENYSTVILFVPCGEMSKVYVKLSLHNLKVNWR